MSKITAYALGRIRRWRAQGESLSTIAQRLSVSRQTISASIRRAERLERQAEAMAKAEAEAESEGENV